MSIVTEVRKKTEGCRVKTREHVVGRKKNPHLEKLREIISDIETGKYENKNVAQKLKNVLSEMDKSPLVLKVHPAVLKVIDDEHYKWRLNHNIAYNESHTGADAISRGLDLLDIIQQFHSVALNPDAELNEDRATRKANESMYWLLLYMKEAESFDFLEPEEAALACLARISDDCFGWFSENLSEASAGEIRQHTEKAKERLREIVKDLGIDKDE